MRIDFNEINWLWEILDCVVLCSAWLAKWLNANKERACFIIFSINMVYWCVRNFSFGFYSQPVLGMVNIMINIYAYRKWRA